MSKNNSNKGANHAPKGNEAAAANTEAANTEAANTEAAPAMTADQAAKAAQDAKDAAKKAVEDARIAAKAAADEAKALRDAKATPIAAPAALTDLVEGQKYNLVMQSPMVVFSKKDILATDKPSKMGGKGVQVEVKVLPGTQVASVKKPGSTRIFYTTIANLDTKEVAPAPVAEEAAAEEAKVEEVAEEAK